MHKPQEYVLNLSFDYNNYSNYKRFMDWNDLQQWDWYGLIIKFQHEYKLKPPIWSFPLHQTPTLSQVL